jgi:GNAT superfamily N-acetyltransferase
LQRASVSRRLTQDIGSHRRDVGNMVVGDEPSPGLVWFEYTEEHAPAFKDFCCGHDGEWTEDLNKFLSDSALQDARDGLNTTYVFYEDKEGGVGIGFVAICAASIPNQLPDPDTKEPIEDSKIVDTKWGNIPSLLIGHIAVRDGYQHLGYGKIMMDWVKALALDLTIGCKFVAVHVQKKNKKAMRFYKRELFFPPKYRQRALWLYDLTDSAVLMRDNDKGAASDGGS